MELKDLLEFSVKQKASDLHISPGQPPILRINGDLMQMRDLQTMDAAKTDYLIKSMMDKEQVETLEMSLELDYSLSLPDIGGFRANAFHQMGGVAGVFRVIPTKIPTLDDVTAPAVFKDVLKLSSGLVLVTGPTGCGKSTTLAAMINHINTMQTAHIITIEDPVEFIHPSKTSLIQQRQVHRDTISFSTALRSALREDPDVILVGEMRDLETIRLALTAAETGHLVVATLHTSSAPRAISRIVDAFPAGEKNVIRNMISESLQAVICQTLVKKIDGGRIAAFEIMLGVPAVRNLIREDRVAQMYSVIQTGSAHGMCTMDQYFQQLIDKKLIHPDAAMMSGFQRELFEKP